MRNRDRDGEIGRREDGQRRECEKESAGEGEWRGECGSELGAGSLELAVHKKKHSLTVFRSSEITSSMKITKMCASRNPI